MFNYPDNTHVRALPLSVRAVNVLLNTGLPNAGAVREHIAEHGWAKIAKATNCGKRTLVEFKSIFGPTPLDEPDATQLKMQKAAKVLLSMFEDPDANAPNGFDWQAMYDEMTADHKESMEICGTHDWPSTLIVALRAMSEATP